MYIVTFFSYVNKYLKVFFEGRKRCLRRLIVIRKKLKRKILSTRHWKLVLEKREFHETRLAISIIISNFNCCKLTNNNQFHSIVWYFVLSIFVETNSQLTDGTNNNETSFTKFPLYFRRDNTSILVFQTRMDFAGFFQRKEEVRVGLRLSFEITLIAVKGFEQFYRGKVCVVCASARSFA